MLASSLLAAYNGAMPSKRPTIIGHHLIWTLYGHWLANDLRGSGSEAVRDPKFAELGAAHLGRKPDALQPSRGEIREFYRNAKPLLQYAPFWIDEAKRQALAGAIGEIVVCKPYTVWACAILSNHVHMVIRRHREEGRVMWKAIAEATLPTLRTFTDVGDDHPVWAARPYSVFLHTPYEVRSRIGYVERNPENEGLARQCYAFVKAYDNWPFHKCGRPR